MNANPFSTMYPSPLCEGTRIEADFCKGRFCIIIDSVKQITPSYILYNAIKYKNGVAKQVEIAELFITSCDKRGKDGKTRINIKKPCRYHELEFPFFEFILKDSPAEKAGVLKGDIIVIFDGDKVADYEELLEVMQYYGPGSEVTLTVMRATLGQYEKVELQIVLGERPDEE